MGTSGWLRLLQDRDQLREAQLGELRREIAKGLDELDAGAGAQMDIAKIKKRGRQQLSRKRSG